VDKADSNRKNAQQSTGPHDTTSTRFNAVKHGLLARGLTELDDSDEYESLIRHLTETYQPIGELEKFFVQRIAFHVIRLQRTQRLEAEYITGEIHPAVKGQSLEEMFEPGIIDEGLPAAVGAVSAINLVSGFQRSKLHLRINCIAQSTNLSASNERGGESLFLLRKL